MGSTVNFAGFAIHSAIHQARRTQFASCTHEKNVTAMASMKCGFLPLSQTHLLAGEFLLTRTDQLPLLPSATIWQSPWELRIFYY